MAAPCQRLTRPSKQPPQQHGLAGSLRSLQDSKSLAGNLQETVLLAGDAEEVCGSCCSSSGASGVANVLQQGCCCCGRCCGARVHGVAISWRSVRDDHSLRLHGIAGHMGMNGCWHAAGLQPGSSARRGCVQKVVSKNDTKAQGICVSGSCMLLWLVQPGRLLAAWVTVAGQSAAAGGCSERVAQPAGACAMHFKVASPRDCCMILRSCCRCVWLCRVLAQQA